MANKVLVFLRVSTEAQELEEQRKEVERDFENAIRKAKSCGMNGDEITQLFKILLGDE